MNKTERRSEIGGEELLRFLGDPASYPHEVDEVEILQTHISYVALAGGYVYKIKKPVKFGFLDFSTLDRRFHYACREIELNSRLCSRIYIGIDSIVMRDDGLFFAEEDASDAIQYAVKMHRLDERRFVSHLLEEDRVSGEQIDRIIGVLAPFYRDQEPADEVLENGRPERVHDVVKGNLDHAGELEGQYVSPAAFHALRAFRRRWFEQRTGLLQRRVEQGRIRDGHGDLRPEHVHLGDDSVCIYDCVEFNEGLRHIDVAADIAFLAMELDHADRQGLARRLVEGLSRELNDVEMKDLMNMYKFYRALVRAKVESLRSEEEEIAPGQREISRERALRYLQLALGYAVSSERPLVLVIMGSIGTGKSTIARALADDLGWPVLSSDRVRKAGAGLPLHDRPPKEVRDKLYSQETSERVYRGLIGAAKGHLDEGHHVILDATFGRREYRDWLRAMLADEEADCVFFEMEAPEPVVKKRLHQRDDRGEEVSDARTEEYTELARAYEPPSELADRRQHVIATDAALDDSRQTIYGRLIDRQFR